jgi:hypothetical protein
MPKLFCRFCSESKISQWKGWPNKQVIPLLSELVDGVCRECGANAIQAINNTDIRWANQHSEHSTGLPSHWQLVIAKGDEFEHWGLPYFGTVLCQQCGANSVLSKMCYPSRATYFSNCEKCGPLETADKGLD